MMAIADRPRHDAADLRRLAELGITPLHWRRSLAQPRPAARRSVLVVHDGGGTKSPLLDSVLRAITLAGMSPQLSSHDPLVSASSPAHVIRLGGNSDSGSAPSDHASTITLPSLGELRGNAAAKRKAWLELRTLLQQ